MVSWSRCSLSEDPEERQGPPEAGWLDRAAQAKWQNQLLEAECAPNHSSQGQVPVKPAGEGQVLVPTRKEAFPLGALGRHEALTCQPAVSAQQTRSFLLLHHFPSHVREERNLEPLDLGSSPGSGIFLAVWL